MISQSSNIAEARDWLERISDPDHRRAFADGYNHAHGIACHCRPEIGQTLRTESEGAVTVDHYNRMDVWHALCYEAEEHSRSFSPWEQVASRINSHRDFESLWLSYDLGVSAAIVHDTEDSD